MRLTGKIRLAVLTLVVGACASTTRMPVTDVPAGTYVLVEPASEEYNAVSINEGAYAVRIGNMTMSGQHWVDADGRLHLVDDTGECAGQESIWTYSYANNRITLDLVEDLCAGREIPSHMVYERS